ncbi:MAG: hypothetical protein EBZ22_06080, partial [Flavobacteriia bacterium]|nr:hypothetical protein [Flavobacteriia bacterium]
MKRLLLFLALALVGCDADYTVGELPIIEINTTQVIRPDEKVRGEMVILDEGKEVLSSTIGIEYRGSTSYRVSDKKSYSIETRIAGDDRAQSLLGMPAESDWILMGHVFRATDPDNFYAFDPTLMHHYISYELARSMGQYASRC